MAYRYLGNKTRLLNWIVGIIDEALPSGGTIADPMCGTASVSEALAVRGFDVSASDVLSFAVLHAKARLLHSAPPSFEVFQGYERAVAHLNQLEPVEGYFFSEFSPNGKPLSGDRPRGYFTAANAMRIDAIRAEIARLRDSGIVTLDEADLLLHDLALAVNQIANITGTYGYFRSSWSSQSLAALTLVCESFTATPGTHSVQQGEAEVTLKSFSGDAIYLDPPYTKRQYGGNYHILETIAVGDSPFAHGAGGLRDWKATASDFCYKRKAPGAFQRVLDVSNANDVFVSYSEDGQVPPDELWSILESYGTVKRYDLPLPRFRSNANVVSGHVREHLYHLRRH